MEVHHHPHVEKKNFKEYFLEFLMIFLAVTMGFFAENIREHFVDKEKEREYVKSFAEDLSKDEIELPQLIAAIKYQQITAADTLQMLLGKADTKMPANTIYCLLRGMIRQQGINIFITDRTIAQVKNSGEMRLIKNKKVSDSLIDYYKEIEFVTYLQNGLLGQKAALAERLRPIFNAADYDKVSDSLDHIVNPKEILHLLSVDPAAINNCLLSVSDIKGLSRTVSIMIIDIKDEAAAIKKLIEREYEL